MSLERNLRGSLGTNTQLLGKPEAYHKKSGKPQQSPRSPTISSMNEWWELIGRLSTRIWVVASRIMKLLQLSTSHKNEIPRTAVVNGSSPT
jgi:hypothetical protein